MSHPFKIISWSFWPFGVMVNERSWAYSFLTLNRLNAGKGKVWGDRWWNQPLQVPRIIALLSLWYWNIENSLYTTPVCLSNEEEVCVGTQHHTDKWFWPLVNYSEIKWQMASRMCQDSSIYLQWALDKILFSQTKSFADMMHLAEWFILGCIKCKLFSTSPHQNVRLMWCRNTETCSPATAEEEKMWKEQGAPWSLACWEVARNLSQRIKELKTLPYLKLTYK